MSKAKTVSSKVMTTSYERLVQRVNVHLNEPAAQASQRCTVRRIEDEFDEDWEKLIDEAREPGIVKVHQEGDDVTFVWSVPADDQ